MQYISLNKSNNFRAQPNCKWFKFSVFTQHRTYNHIIKISHICDRNCFLSMFTLYFILTAILVLVTILPLFSDQHWFFRIWDFGKVQLAILQLLVFVTALFLIPYTLTYIIFQSILIIACAYNIIVLIKYTPLYKRHRDTGRNIRSESITVLGINVYQFNKEYSRLLDLIRKTRPDMILTMESNKDWEEALAVLDKDYKSYSKNAQENTYGMHFYTNLKVNKLETHYFIADDVPSIEAELETKDGFKFVFFGVHPPPPSPTEEENSKERDGELLSVSKLVRNIETAVVVAGDFNNVAWAKSSVLFRKTSELIDPRVGRGLVSTFHAKYWFLRFPIDLFFHSTDVFIEEFKALEDVGSDHFPLYCRFYIGSEEATPKEGVETLEEGEMEEVNEMIEEGKKENGHRKPVAKE